MTIEEINKMSLKQLWYFANQFKEVYLALGKTISFVIGFSCYQRYLDNGGKKHIDMYDEFKLENERV